MAKMRVFLADLFGSRAEAEKANAVRNTNFDITGASIDQTNPAHHMVLRRSRRKVKLQSQTGSIQETVEHQVDSSSESMESGIKQGNSRFTKQKQPQDAYTMERDEEV
ncbi:hypothetical protein POTOM_053616 [Populus tomentosa]|uniref:Uncharacterized protein n=1 Tax=Populus tomentosa TaxID=118781 RepID=A0A8X7Y254_POPTO|nr:hypothetical protein POTOM_053616 [Populus tomentosa]